jgi:hypothetical protein
MMADKAKITSAEENGKDIAKIGLFISTMSCVFKQQVCHDRAFVNLIQGSIGSTTNNIKLVDQHNGAIISSSHPKVKFCGIIASINIEPVLSDLMHQTQSLVTYILPNCGVCV